MHNQVSLNTLLCWLVVTVGMLVLGLGIKLIDWLYKIDSPRWDRRKRK